MSELKMIEAAILAAGEGRRILPITNFFPKPLLPIVTRPLLENIILSLKRQHIKKICINVHHLRGRIIDFLQRKQYDMEIEISIEDRILGTGGGISRMRRYIKGENFVIHNGDVVTDMKIHDAFKFHKKKNGLATLLIEKRKHSKDIQIDKAGRIIDIAERLKPKGKAQGTFGFTGITILNRKIFDFLPEDDFHDIIDTFASLITEGENIFGFVCRNNYWSDIGTKEKYLLVHKEILIDRKYMLYDFSLPATPFFIGKESLVSKKTELSGFVSIGENCYIGDTVRLENCVIFDNTILDDGKTYKNCIISKDFIG
ncbi:NDP-sugar synthase [candidate division WOR-3 bacterium]|nr:NDP-sugar synthase [candidate division WOR-3 bacterium]